ncbi:MAG: alpha-ribazole phosphatase [Desulfobacteraceae bacterium]|nr:alpha-ribazole phosphatase [Desulfobacteraceae bacterium]
MRIYLLRHGEIDLQGEKRFIGQTDLPLNQNGTAQAYYWHRELADVVFSGIFCSDLRRTYKTACIIAGHENVQAMPQLREIKLGEWEGLSMLEIRTCFPDEWKKRGEDIVTYRPQGGESFADLHARAVPVFEQISGESDGNVLIVAHGGVNRVILCHVLGMPADNLFRLNQDYGCLNIIDCSRTPVQLTAMNIQGNLKLET